MAKKIGVFDSGVGGLTVLKSLVSQLGHYDFVYIGDTARLPYGTKSPETIRAYSVQILNYFAKKELDAIVIACNTASSQIPEKEWNDTPIFNVIEPGAKLALAKTIENRIGVLGTRALVNSNAYERKIRDLSESQNSQPLVFQQACPLFVPLAEEGWIDDPITNLIAYRYVQPLVLQKIDTLILGCTHYPLLRNAIQKACGNTIQLIESGEALALEMKNYFEIMKPSSSEVESPSVGKIEILLTDYSEHLRLLCEQILAPHIVDKIESFSI